MSDFFSGLVGGVVGAVAAVDLPAEGERLPKAAPGTAWGDCRHKLGEGVNELERFLQEITFVIGKLASCMRLGLEHLTTCIAQGKAPSSSCLCLLDKNDVHQSIEAGKQGGEYLLRASKLLLEALLEASKVAATRSLLLVENSKQIILSSVPITQEKLHQTYSSFLRGYQSSSRASVGYGQPSYHQQQPSSYGAPPATEQQSSGFFW